MVFKSKFYKKMMIVNMRDHLTLFKLINFVHDFLTFRYAFISIGKFNNTELYLLFIF